MSFAELLAHPSARLLTLALAHFLWQGLAIALLLVVLIELCGVRRATARYACSLMALLVMIACPLGTLAWLGTRAEEFNPRAAESLAAPAAPVTNPRLVSHRFAAGIAAAQPYALAAWLVGVVLFGGRLLGGAIGVLQLRRGREPLPDKLAPIVTQLGRRLKINSAQLVFLSRNVAEAMAIGIVRPLVLIPAAWASEMPLDLLEAVIAHELAHLRRRDLWVNLLQRVVETVLFYHPAVWWLSRRLRIERELCADELAVAATGNRLAYAQALEQVAHQQPAPVGPLLAAFLRGEKDMRLLHRVRNVLRPAKDDRSRLWPAGLVALALPLGLWLASVGMGVATADDERERERPSAEREREAKESERRIEIRRDGDRPRKEIARDGEKPRKPGPRDEEARRKETGDGEVRRVIVKDLGNGNKEFEEIIERKIGAKEAAARERKKIERDLDEQLTQRKPDFEARRIEELSVVVKRLAAQVEKLQDEVTSLRGKNPGNKADFGRDVPATRAKQWTREDIDASKRELQEAARKIEVARQAIIEKEAALAEFAARQQSGDAEKAAAAAREQAKQAGLKKEEIQELIERKQAEAKRAAEAAIRKKLEALEREKERDIPDEELQQLKKRTLRDEQSLLLDREREDRPSLKLKIRKEKPLEEKPSEQ